MLVRSKLGFEPIQNRSGLKKRPERVLSVLRLHSHARPSTRPSVCPSTGGCPLSSPATRRTRVRLYAKEKGKKKQLKRFRRLCSRSEQQHQQNHQPTSSRLHVHQGASSEPTHTVYKGPDSARHPRALASAG